MSTLTRALPRAPAYASRLLERVQERWTRTAVAVARAWSAARRMDTGTVMLLIGILFALVFVYALGVTTLTRRH